MGFALAKEAAKRGLRVSLISGPVDLDTPEMFIEPMLVQRLK